MRAIILTLLTIIGCGAINAGISFTGNSHSVITENAEASTGLNNIYILQITIHETSNTYHSYSMKKYHASIHHV